MANEVYHPALLKIQRQELDYLTATIKCLLLNASGTFTETHEFVSSVVANELTGYTRPTVTSKTITDDGDYVIFGAASAAFGAVPTAQTIGAVVVFAEITNDAASPVIAFLDPADLATNGQDVTATFTNNTIFRIPHSNTVV